MERWTEYSWCGSRFKVAAPSESSSDDTFVTCDSGSEIDDDDLFEECQWEITTSGVFLKTEEQNGYRLANVDHEITDDASIAEIQLEDAKTKIVELDSAFNALDRTEIKSAAMSGIDSDDPLRESHCQTPTKTDTALNAARLNDYCSVADFGDESESKDASNSKNRLERVETKVAASEGCSLEEFEQFFRGAPTTETQLEEDVKTKFVALDSASNVDRTVTKSTPTTSSNQIPVWKQLIQKKYGQSTPPLQIECVRPQLARKQCHFSAEANFKNEGGVHKKTCIRAQNQSLPTKEDVFDLIKHYGLLTLNDFFTLFEQSFQQPFTASIASKVLQTNATSLLMALKFAFGKNLHVQMAANGEADGECWMSTSRMMILDAPKTRIPFTKDVLIAHLVELPRIYLRIYEMYIEDYYDVDLDLDTWNALLGTSAMDRKEAFIYYFGIALAIREDTADDLVLELKRVNLTKEALEALAPEDEIEQFIMLLTLMSPVYSSTFWGDYAAIFDATQPSLESLNERFGTFASTPPEFFTAICGNQFEWDYDPAFDEIIMSCGSSIRKNPRHTDDYLKFKFVDLIRFSQEITLHDLTLKLYKEIGVCYDLDTMNRIFKTNENYRQLVLQNALSGIVSTEGHDFSRDGKHLILQYVGGAYSCIVSGDYLNSICNSVQNSDRNSMAWQFEAMFWPRCYV